MRNPTKLARIRTGLSRLRRRRRSVRIGTALSRLFAATLWILMAALLVDWVFEMDRPQRIVSLCACAVAVLWTVRRWVSPLLGRKESDLDMALLVEREQRIDSDLVAALQFERPDAASWGSRELREAVVDYVSEYGKELDLFKGFSRRQLAVAAGALLATGILLGGASILFPAHARVFLDRLLLGTTHYPTRTRIESILVNGVEAFPRSAGVLRMSAGGPVVFEALCSGQLPQEGSVVLRTAGRGGGAAQSAIRLKPRDAQASAAESGVPGGEIRVYSGELERLLASVEYTVRIGDAWTDAARIDAIALPVVSLELKPVPPAYALAGKAEPEDLEGARQASVVEGSRVDIAISCANKDLREAVLILGGARHSLAAETPRRWTLQSRGTPLERVTEPLSFEVDVVDSDGLGLGTPMAGSIRIKPDRKPRVAAAAVSSHVLPTAKPVISYGATDDYGIARLAVLAQVTRADSRSESSTTTLVDVPPESQPRTSLRGRHPFDLSPLRLAKGDQVTLTLEAMDYRGDREGKSATSDPMVLHVTDERGVLAAMMDSDERSARQLDAIIERQLGIGEGR